MKMDYVALDLETTGLNPSRDRILEIGAVKVVGGRITDTYQTFVNPGVPIPEKICELTGIDDTMTADAAPPAEAVRELIDFCGDLDLLGHNIIFDYSFIKRTAVNCDMVFDKQGVDTLKIARKLLPDLESRSLEYLCDYYHITQEKRHRAYEDAKASSCLYGKLLEQFYPEHSEVFRPRPLVYQIKKQGPITNSQKRYLIDLIKYHKIDTSLQIESLTKNEASRVIDKIILEYGKIKTR